jgi:plastocyanin
VLAAPAGAATKTYVLRSKPVSVAGFATVNAKLEVPTPEVDGSITKFDTYLVHRGAPKGMRFPARHVMLHHVLFVNRSAPGRSRGETCGRRSGEGFYGTGEERQRLVLPPGYGYRVRKGDRWRIGMMLMSHGIQRHELQLEYRFTVVTKRRLTPVTPLWMRASGCVAGYNLDGGGAPGSLDRRSYDWKVPVSGRIVAAGAHTHAGNRSLDVAQPRCGDRRIIRHESLFGRADDPVYRMRPLLHEPGPIATGYYLSARGIAVRRGETLRVTAVYEAEWPRPEVMGITHLYIARDRRAARDRCGPAPQRYIWTRRDGRPSAPRMAIPFNVWDAKEGRTKVVDRPPGPEVDGGSNARVQVRDDGFAPTNLIVDRGAAVRWDWVGRDEHNVWYAGGPRMVATVTGGRGTSTTKQLSTPGTYKLFCYLHPLTMHQRIVVR